MKITFAIFAISTFTINSSNLLQKDFIKGEYQAGGLLALGSLTFVIDEESKFNWEKSDSEIQEKLQMLTINKYIYKNHLVFYTPCHYKKVTQYKSFNIQAFFPTNHFYERDQEKYELQFNWNEVQV